ncbi:MAG: hypothetical protein A3K60_00440 [Euryarchaeota archaeon RBG_19FT_COMBO_56_21]|nr:MAG: hypothetical protein A3K60_00440 [Euryarchaeota archaeon RBG_19FT_COMBO_56_21]
MRAVVIELRLDLNALMSFEWLSPQIDAGGAASAVAGSWSGTDARVCLHEREKTIGEEGR